ncbi:MAG: hypothetical protein V1492_00755 [Candidatus Micrarchaeota archaeon]
MDILLPILDAAPHWNSDSFCCLPALVLLVVVGSFVLMQQMKK